MQFFVNWMLAIAGIFTAAFVLEWLFTFMIEWPFEE